MSFMKTIIKRITILSIFAFLLISLIVPVFAHPGSLDENGGHYNRSTGEYHYHHGYPEHQHENGECPYDFHDNANTEYTPQDEKPTNSSSSTTRYYYFEEFEEFTTSNFSNSVNNSIQAETTTQNKTPSSDSDDSLLPLILAILPAAILGSLAVFIFLLKCINSIKEKSNAKKSTIAIQEEKQKSSSEKDNLTSSTKLEKPSKENIKSEHNEQHNKQNEYHEQISYPTGHNKRIDYPIEYNKHFAHPKPYSEQLNKPNEYYERIDKQRTLNALASVSLSELFGSFPKDIRIQDNFELLFENSDNNAPYGRYTIYIDTDNPVLHKQYDCHSPTRKVLALNCFGAFSFRFCDKCWDKKSKKQANEFFAAEWYDSYQFLIDRMEIHKISPKEIIAEKKKKLSPILEKSEFQFWRVDIHTTISQMQRIYRTKEITIIDYKPDTKEAKVQGSKGDIYTTSFSSCNCKDFSIHHLPCKHMYKLAAEHGGIDFSKYV